MATLQPTDLIVEAWPPPARQGLHVGMPKGVKVTHRPTGLVATCDSERSQHRCRDQALAELQAKVNAAKAVAPATTRALRSGRLVPELTAPEDVRLTTRCPSKWLAVDLETGQVWSPANGKWKRASSIERAEAASILANKNPQGESSA
jgi:hypothetical protein